MSSARAGQARRWFDTALRGLGHPGLFVTAYDPDTVTEANIGRQLFSPSDIGLNKAQCLVTRMNHFFGNGWKAVPDIYPAILKDTRRDNLANITITCTDNVKSRLDLWNTLKAVPVSEYRSYETPHGQRQVTARPVEHAESRAGFGIQKLRDAQLRDAPLLDGLRKHADIRPGRAWNGTEENQATGFPALRNCQLAESHHPAGEICERERE